MSDLDPAAELAALRAALAAERTKTEALSQRGPELRGLVARAVGLTAQLLQTGLTAEQRDHVERLRSLTGSLAGVVDAVLGVDGEGRGPPRVLVVEDDAVNQRLTRALLEKRGYAVDVAGDGREAVEATGRAAYAAVLMDCHMPRLDGYAATGEIRAREQSPKAVAEEAPRPRLAIIGMTADADAGARERCLAAGMDDYVAKPVTGETLDAVLRRWVPHPPPAAPPAAAKRRPSSPAVDLGMLRRMRAAQGPAEADIVAEVVALFLEEAPTRLAAIQDAAALGDLAAAARAAHTLKGSAGHLGARTLATLCTRFEEKTRAGSPFDVAFAASAIAEELERVQAALAAERGRPG